MRLEFASVDLDHVTLIRVHQEASLLRPGGLAQRRPTCNGVNPRRSELSLQGEKLPGRRELSSSRDTRPYSLVHTQWKGRLSWETGFNQNEGGEGEERKRERLRERRSARLAVNLNYAKMRESEREISKVCEETS